jgi:hypothetical protein
VDAEKIFSQRGRLDGLANSFISVFARRRLYKKYKRENAQSWKNEMIAEMHEAKNGRSWWAAVCNCRRSRDPAVRKTQTPDFVFEAPTASNVASFHNSFDCLL